MKTILLVEDNQKYRELLKTSLKDEGFILLEAENGEKAIDLVKKAHIDLIVLDLLMPEMDGVSFYYQMKNMLQKHISIIVLTNVTDAAAYGAEIKDVLIKANTSLDEVVSKIHQTIG